MLKITKLARLTPCLKMNGVRLLMFCALGLNAEPHVWTSTSGSEIEATYLGSFDDELWFEGKKPQRRLLKMPAKYISAADLALIESKEIRPQIAPQSIDKDDASTALLEELFKTKVTEPLDSTQTLKEALRRLVGQIPQSEDAELRIKFHRKVDEDATRTDLIKGSTVYACLKDLTDAHELKWSIRKGTLTLRSR